MNLANPYLGGTLNYCVQTVKVALETAPNPRFKPVVMTVRGVGSGKTRVLEEIRRELNEDPNTVVLSVTLNNNMDYVAAVESFTPTLSVNFVFSILLRYLAVVYKLEFVKLIYLFAQEIKSLDTAALTNLENMALFARHFLARIARDIKSNVVADKNEDFNIVFLIDEIMRMKFSMINSKLHDEIHIHNQFIQAASSIN